MRGSFLFLDQTKENKFSGGGKEKKKRKEKKEKKGRKKRKERKTKEMREKSVRGKEGKRGKKGKGREPVVHSPIPGVLTIESR